MIKFVAMLVNSRKRPPEELKTPFFPTPLSFIGQMHFCCSVCFGKVALPESMIGGVIADWNERTDCSQQIVRPGDLILSVNGATGERAVRRALETHEDDNQLFLQRRLMHINVTKDKATDMSFRLAFA
eukprot:5277188-Amphidinium_carterae.1